MNNLFQPWILLRLISATTIAVLFVRASSTSLRVVRSFDLARTNEGQLLLERRMELAATYARMAAVAAALDLGLGVLSADRLSHSLKGAMCAYGVFGSSAWGWISLGASIALAIGGGLLSQLYAFDARLPRFELARALSIATGVTAPIALANAALATIFLTGLDLTAVASCCSVDLDGPIAQSSMGIGHPGARVTLLGAILVGTAAVSALLVARRPTRRSLAWVAGAALLAGASGSAAVVWGVAPHAFETPHHLCPFCLLRFDVHAIGYPLFGALYLGVVWSVGAALGAWLSSAPSAAPTESESEWNLGLVPFARSRLRRSAVALGLALLLGAGPVVRYAWLSGGTLLFP